MLVSFGALAHTAITADNVQARLISEQVAVAPGTPLWVALEFKIRAGWHTYWRNPGDSGKATTLQWDLPQGFSAGEIQWTTPHRFELPPLVNFGYAEQALHLVRIAVPATLPRNSTVVLRAQASWLVCADVCIPESAAVELKLPVTTGTAVNDPATAARFAAARAALPVAAPAPVSLRREGTQLVLTLGRQWGASLAQIESLSFFPYTDGAIDYGSPQTLTRRDGELELKLQSGYQPPADGVLRGLLVATEVNGTTRSELPLEISATGAAGVTPQASPMPQGREGPLPGRTAGPAGGEYGLGLLLGFALLGGLILNLMPCVFPVLSIKALGLAEQAKKDPAAVRAKGLVFAAGVISSMLALAGALLALRAGGAGIGWGFQLQSPLFVTLMVYLLLAVGLNLSGVFEIGGSLAGLGDGLTRGDSYRAAFFTGCLTTLVATPCTAPFMAAAVGAALTQPAVTALSIFAALGLGLALPYLFLSFTPWLRVALPRPGPWMDTLKQVFAFPMYASAAWLLWVLAQQSAQAGLAAACAGIVLVGLAAWAYQRAWPVTTAITVLAAVLLPLQAARLAPAAVASVSAPATTVAPADEWQPYDAARLAELSGGGTPVLVNFTASWCLTCLVNERNAFGDPKVQALFRDKRVVLMKGDWTNRDPAITAALSAFGRAGVPLYLLYNAPPGAATPRVLPQLLTPGVVAEALATVPDHPTP